MAAIKGSAQQWPPNCASCRSTKRKGAQLSSNSESRKWKWIPPCLVCWTIIIQRNQEVCLLWLLDCDRQVAKQRHRACFRTSGQKPTLQMTKKASAWHRILCTTPCNRKHKAQIFLKRHWGGWFQWWENIGRTLGAHQSFEIWRHRCKAPMRKRLNQEGRAASQDDRSMLEEVRLNLCFWQVFHECQASCALLPQRPPRASTPTSLAHIALPRCVNNLGIANNKDHHQCQCGVFLRTNQNLSNIG